jgi:hypothetical protein
MINMDRNKKGQFKKGHIPWSKGKKGIHLSPQSEFKKGQKGINWVPIGTIKTRVRKTREDTRKWIKIAEPNKWKEYAKYIWEKYKGPIPKGILIHHKDRNKLNDNIENLELKSRAEHMNEHRREIRKKWEIKSDKQ